MIEMILTTKAGFPFFNRPGRRQAALINRAGRMYAGCGSTNSKAAGGIR